MRISGGGIDSFLGFEYCDVITLASRVFRVLLAVLPTSLRCLRIFGFVWVAGLLRPHLSCLHSRFTVVRSLSWGFSLVWRSSGLLLRWRRSLGRFTAPILLLALRSAADVAFFSQISRIFALVWRLLLFLRNFRFYSLATLMVYPFFAPSVFWLGPPSLVVTVSVCGVSFFLSVPAELCLLPLLLLGVGWALAEPLLVWLLCLWSWGTCGFPLSVLQWLQVG